MAKSRKPKLQLTREPARPTTPAQDGTVHPLTGRLRATFDAIVCGTALVQNGLIPENFAEALLDDPQFAMMLDSPSRDGDDDATLDEDLEGEDYDAALEREEALLDAEIERIGDTVAEIATSTRILARSLIAQALGKPVDAGAQMADGRRVDIGGHTLDDIVGRLQPASVPAPLRPSPSSLREAFDEAAGLVREVGLEEFDVDCELVPTWNGVVELVAHRVTPERAHIALIGTLFDRAEAAASVEDPFVSLERIASLWEIERWSVAPPAGLMAPELADVTRRVRSDEFRLVDRTLVALGESVVGRVADDDGFRKLFPRQHRMACAFMESFVDIFEVTEITGPRSTWRSILHDASYEVHEHQDRPPYHAGWIAAGRLIPFDDARHLCSPGTMFFQVAEPGLARHVAETFARLEESIPSAVALEAAISSAFFGVVVPRNVKPAQSRANAYVMLDELDAMIANGFELDSTLTAFMKALERQTGVDDSRRGAGAGKHAKERTGKRSKRRRR